MTKIGLVSIPCACCDLVKKVPMTVEFRWRLVVGGNVSHLGWNLRGLHGNIMSLDCVVRFLRTNHNTCQTIPANRWTKLLNVFRILEIKILICKLLQRGYALVIQSRCGCSFAYTKSRTFIIYNQVKDWGSFLFIGIIKPTVTTYAIAIRYVSTLRVKLVGTVKIDTCSKYFYFKNEFLE